MKVLVACEYSGRVRDAFAAAGHDAMSCDLLPTATPGNHYQGDVMDLKPRRIEGAPPRWDLLIAFPPCTYLSYAGNAWWNRPGRAEAREAAAEFARQFEDWAPQVAVENPRGYLREYWRQEDQVVQPWMFGDPYTKRTCLWLKGLPPLRATNIVPTQGSWVSSGSVKHSMHHNPKLRSLTFPGLAAAMAAQWGCAPLPKSDS